MFNVHNDLEKFMKVFGHKVKMFAFYLVSMQTPFKSLEGRVTLSSFFFNSKKYFWES